MKEKLLIILISFLSYKCFAQDNPYALFGYKSKVEYKENRKDKLRVKNPI